MQLGVGGVPGQEVGGALFAPGTPQQVDIRHVGVGQVAGEVPFADVVGVELSVVYVASERGGGAELATSGMPA